MAAVTLVQRREPPVPGWRSPYRRVQQRQELAARQCAGAETQQMVGGDLAVEQGEAPVPQLPVEMHQRIVALLEVLG